MVVVVGISRSWTRTRHGSRPQIRRPGPRRGRGLSAGRTGVSASSLHHLDHDHDHDRQIRIVWRAAVTHSRGVCRPPKTRGPITDHAGVRESQELIPRPGARSVWSGDRVSVLELERCGNAPGSDSDSIHVRGVEGGGRLSGIWFLGVLGPRGHPRPLQPWPADPQATDPRALDPGLRGGRQLPGLRNGLQLLEDPEDPHRDTISPRFGPTTGGVGVGGAACSYSVAGWTPCALWIAFYHRADCVFWVLTPPGGTPEGRGAVAEIVLD